VEELLTDVFGQHRSSASFLPSPTFMADGGQGQI
jgi:hypothetical protein